MRTVKAYFVLDAEQSIAAAIFAEGLDPENWMGVVLVEGMGVVLVEGMGVVLVEGMGVVLVEGMGVVLVVGAGVVRIQWPSESLAKPVSHSHAPMKVLPGCDVELSGHILHVSIVFAPIASENVPFLQSMQRGDPGTLLYFPAAHVEHRSPSRPKNPLLHIQLACM